MKAICAFSSDSRTLYKADIYRVLALPNGGIVHFRYKNKYVADELVNSKTSLEGRRVAIFFTRTEKSGLPSGVNENISVRWASVFSIEKSSETDVFHIYMKLGDFCNVSINPGVLGQEPPSKFLSCLDIQEQDESNNWHGRVQAIKDYFPSLTYFQIKSIVSNGSEVALNYHGESRSSFFKLKYGNRYLLRLGLANPDGSGTQIAIADGSGDVAINYVTPLETSVQFDDVEVPIFAKSLQVTKQASFLEIKPVSSIENFAEYAIHIELELKHSVSQPILFGLCTVAAGAAISLATPVAATAIRPDWYVYVISAGLLWLASGAMFYWFNKK